MVDTYRARRRLQMAPGVYREPGDLVPEAHTWAKVMSWLHTGYITETTVSDTELRAAIATYCPELTDRVLELAGLGDAVLEGQNKTPRVYVTKKPEPAPAAETAPRRRTAKKDAPQED